MAFKWRRGLTLAEIACMIGVSGLVGGVVAVVVLQAGIDRERSSAASAVAALDAGIRSFEAMRGAPPADLDGDGVTSATEVVSQLKSWGILEGSFAPVDPWGHPYVIVLRPDSVPGHDAAFDRPYGPDSLAGDRQASLTGAGALGETSPAKAVPNGIDDSQL
jgi:hypothetical protein